MDASRGESFTKCDERLNLEKLINILQFNQ